MTPQKYTKISKKSDVFGEKFWKNILSYLKKKFSQIFFDFGQKRLILHYFCKLKKKKKQMANLGQSNP